MDSMYLFFVFLEYRAKSYVVNWNISNQCEIYRENFNKYLDMLSVIYQQKQSQLD